MRKIKLSIIVLLFSCGILRAQNLSSTQIDILEHDAINRAKKVNVVGGGFSITGSTVIVQKVLEDVKVSDVIYNGKEYDGMAGLIMTNTIITPANPIYSFTFKYRNDNNDAQYCSITSNLFSGSIQLADGDIINVNLPVPKSGSFTITNIDTSASLQYMINSLQE